MIKKLLLVSLILCHNAYAGIIESSVPGGIKKITIPSKTMPVIEYNDKRIAVIKEGTKFVAVIGIPLDTKIATQTIWQQIPDKKSYAFKLKNKKYRVQKLTIKNKRKVTPHNQDQERIDNESLDFAKTLDHWSDKQTAFTESFIAPVHGYITSTYGLKRIYNGIPKSPHTALDIAAKLGTPIKATASGRVINIHHRFYTGNTVVIDHGQGLMSLYAHLNKFKVKNGQWVKQGDVIGTVGKTGRVTGPHLHWALYLNQTSIDPLLFINKKDITNKTRMKKKLRVKVQHA